MKRGTQPGKVIRTPQLGWEGRMLASKRARGINFEMYGYHKDSVQITNHKAVRQAYTIQKSEHSLPYVSPRGLWPCGPPHMDY